VAAPCLAQQAPGDALAHGAQIFEQRCARCHGDHGEGRSAIITIAGPSIRAEHDYGKVMTAVEVGPSHMPSFAYVLSVDDMRAVSHFVVDKIADIPLGPGDLADGGKLFRTHCASCHRTAVRGGAMAYVGVNAPALYSKSAALVAGAVRWGPGPMPSFPPSVLDDKQLSSLVAYVRYAQAPASPGGSPLNWYGPVAEGFAAWVIIFALVAIAIWIEKGGRG
jgi:ubiquinol-cytochrome c reductase cytochrome c subunit